MIKYKECYFKLFSAVCDTIEMLEQLLTESTLPESQRQLLLIQIDTLKKVQQETEELLIS